MKMRKSAYFLWFRYYEPKLLEAYLEEQGRLGWHPLKFNFGALLRTNFIKGDPVKYRYVVDYQFIHDKDYIEIYKSFGWTLVGKFSDMYVWRMEYTDSRPEAFSSIENKQCRNNKIANMYLLFAVICLVCSIISILKYVYNLGSLKIWDNVGLVLEIILFTVLTAVLGRRVFKLKK